MKSTFVPLVGIVLMCCVQSYASSVVQVRFNDVLFNAATSELTVDIEILNEESSFFILGSQNYRLFYDSKQLLLNRKKSVSELPDVYYDDIQIVDNVSGVNAKAVSDLLYDADLGFLNFNINLKDNTKGGIRISGSDGWIKIASLSFKVIDPSIPSRATWARKDITQKYASAFVELAEWKGPQKIESISISSYHDLHFVLDKQLTPVMEVTMVPNPVRETLKVSLSIPASTDLTLLITDASGRQVGTHVILYNSNETLVEVNEYPAGLYSITLLDPQKALIFQDRIMIAR